MFNISDEMIDRIMSMRTDIRFTIGNNKIIALENASYSQKKHYDKLLNDLINTFKDFTFDKNDWDKIKSEETEVGHNVNIDLSEFDENTPWKVRIVIKRGDGIISYYFTHPSKDRIIMKTNNPMAIARYHEKLKDFTKGFMNYFQYVINNDDTVEERMKVADKALDRYEMKKHMMKIMEEDMKDRNVIAYGGCIFGDTPEDDDVWHFEVKDGKFTEAQLDNQDKHT